MLKSELIQLFFYMIGLAFYAIAMYTDMEIFLNDRVYKLTGFNGAHTFGKKFKYLTYLDLVL